MLDISIKESISHKLLSSNDRSRKICFFLSNITTPYEGIAKVFINWGAKLSEYKNEIHFVLLNCSGTIRQMIEKKNANVVITEIKKAKELLKYFQDLSPEIVIIDDDLQRLRLISKIRGKLKIKTCVYSQILFGAHSIVDVFDLSHLFVKDRIIYQMLRIIPFNLLKLTYKRLLLRQDLILANSKTTATFLHVLYGIEPDEIIYPGLDTTEFRHYKNKITEQTNKILIYLGSHAGDTNEDLVRKICRVLENRKLKILVFGNDQLQEKLKSEFSIDGILNVSDHSLAKIYSECKLTICPQKWEMFGYVVAESISCGTPVLAFNLMGPSEIITQTKMGMLANNEKEFLKKLNDFNFGDIKENKDKEFYSWELDYSVIKLREIITALEE